MANESAPYSGTGEGKESSKSFRTEFVSRDGSILDSRASVLVNPVNRVGVSGAGLAKRFAERFPRNDEAYRRWCAQGCPGDVCVVTRDYYEPDDYYSFPWIANVPTKHHWRARSDPELIARGLAALADVLAAVGSLSVAVPMLGCGLGGLRWEDVRPVVVERLGAVDGLRVELYERPTRARGR